MNPPDFTVTHPYNKRARTFLGKMKRASADWTRRLAKAVSPLTRRIRPPSLSTLGKVAWVSAKITLKIIVGLFLTYAVLFAVAGTAALVLAYNYAMAPVIEVRKLATVNPAETAFMAACRKNLRATRQRDTLFHVFVPIDSIPLVLQRAVLAAEDDGFYVHPGFDLQAMLAALEYNQSYNKVKRGASTITQQLAKNLFLSTEKSYVRKAREFIYTILLERYCGKKRILELYLNYAQWGPTTFGCEAASQQYFHKSVRKLTFGEAARLAAVLAAPCRVAPTRNESAFMGKRFLVIANNMYRRRQLDSAGYFAMTGMPPPDSSQPPDSMATVANPPSAIPVLNGLTP